MATLSKAMLISFLVIALTASTFSGSLAIEVVLDINGSPIKPNVPYYIQSASQLLTKSISRGKRLLNTLCPQAALLSTTPVAVKFLVKAGGDVVPLSAAISIVFDGADQCLESGIWQVVYNPLLLLPDITATGSLFALDSTFKIEKHNNAYKIVYGSDLASLGVFTDLLSLVGHLVVLPSAPLDVVFAQAII